jgi:hypothetical protein
VLAAEAIDIILGLFFFGLMVSGLAASLRRYGGARRAHKTHVWAGRKHDVDCPLCRQRWGSRLEKMVETDRS